MHHQAVNTFVSFHSFSRRCVVFYALRADLVTIKVYLLFYEAVLFGQLIATTKHCKPSPQHKHSLGYPWYNIDPDTEYKQITLCMSHLSYKTEQ